WGVWGPTGSELALVETTRAWASVGPPPLAARLRRFARPSPPKGGRVATAPQCSKITRATSCTAPISLHLGPRLAHHRRPLLLLAVDVGGIFVGRARQRLGAFQRE